MPSIPTTRVAGEASRRPRRNGRAIMSVTKCFWGALGIGILLTVPARAQTSAYSEVNLAGSFNGWNTTTNKMLLIANNTWQTDLILTNKSFEFKFTTPNWTFNWGDNDKPNTNLPVAGTGESGGANIKVTNGVDNSLFRFTINTSTREYAVFLLNNIGTNLLFNGSFEIQGSSQYSAQYWEQNQPNLHGAENGAGDRSDYGGAHSGTWKVHVFGTWAGQGDNGSFWQEAPVEGGLPCVASAWFQAESTAWTSTLQELRLDYYDFNRTNLLATFSTNLAAVSTSWAQYSITGAAPAQAYWARLVFNVSGSGTDGTLRMDDAAVSPVASLRSEDFNAWGYASAQDDCYVRAGWIICTGRTVSAIISNNEEIILARSGHAASLPNLTAGTNGAYIQSPRLAEGVGTVRFWYRHGHVDTNSEPEQSVALAVQLSSLGLVWTNVAVISNIYDTAYRSFSLYKYEPDYRYVRIIHVGGSTNRLLVDDISIDEPATTTRLMDFDSWPDSGTNEGCHSFLDWSVCTGLVSETFAKSGKSAQILGNTNSSSYLMSPLFAEGFSMVSFSYRRGLIGFNTVGFAVEYSPNDMDWYLLGLQTNISALSWQNYSIESPRFTPHRIRIRSLRETNILENASASLDEPFDGGASPPAGWTFSQIGQYTTAASSGRNPPSLSFNQNGSFVITPILINPTNVTFMTLGQSISAESTFVVEGMTGGVWATVTIYTNLTNSKITRSVKLTNITTQLRFTYNKISGNVAFDDVIVTGIGYTGPVNAAQTLLLDDVEVTEPIEYRTQNFDTWPLKASFDSGTTQYQGWVLGGLAKVNTNKTYSGQSLQLTRSSGGSTYYVDFEGVTKGSYASATVNLSGVPWDMTEALIGTEAADWKNGLRSARLRGYAASSMTMMTNLASGLGTISFNYCRYATDANAQTNWIVEYSTNNGTSWTQIGSPFTATTSTNPQTFTQTVNIPGPVRVRIKRATAFGSDSNRRLNIDDILITGYGGGGEVDAYVQPHYLRDGVGAITFQYRHWMDSTPPTASVMRARIQSSSNGAVWTTQDTLYISNTTFRTYDLYLFETNQYYARIFLDQGNSIAMLDEITVARPQLPANVELSGTISPPAPYTNDAVSLTAQSIQRYGARNLSVTSYYRIGTSGVFTAWSMAGDGGNWTSASNIPPQPTGTVVQYYFRCDFQGPGSQFTSPVFYPAGGVTNPAWYGIPRNPPGKVWINEIDYDALDWDLYQDRDFIELAGTAGSDISGWQVRIQDITGTTYRTFAVYTMPGSTAIANQTNGYGFYVLANTNFPAPPRNMSMTNVLWYHIPGVVRLYNEMGGLEHALAYDAGMPGVPRIYPRDVEYQDVPTNSVALTGSGGAYAHFAWTNRAPTPGAANPGQVFGSIGSITCIPSSLTFGYIPGSYSPAAQYLVVSNSGAASIDYTVGTNVAWLSITPATITGLQPGGLQVHAVSVNTDGLAGNKGGSLNFIGNADNNPVVPVNLTAIGIGSVLLYYPANDAPGDTVFNQGTIGSPGHLMFQNGLDWTPAGGGISGTAGDYALWSTGNSAHARSSAVITSLNAMAQFTLTGWIKASGTGGVHRLIGNRSSTNGFALLTSSNYQNLAFVSSPSGSPTPIVSTNGLFPAAEWAFFAVVFDGTNTSVALRFYGGSVGGRAYEHSTHSLNGLGPSGAPTGSLFVAGDGTNSFVGELDDVRLYAGLKDLMTIEAIRIEGAEAQGEVVEAPQVVVHPQSFTGDYFTVQSISVTASGIPAPGYQWRKDGTPLPGRTDATIFFDPFLLDDAGVYDVIVSNIAGWVVISSAVVVVLAPPEILLHPVSRVIYAGESVLFTASATGTPTMLYQWRWGGTNLPGETNPLLLLANVQTGQLGNYTVHITNRVSFSNSAIAVLTVRTLNMSESGGFIRPNPSGAGTVLRFPTISNRWYEVWWSSNLMLGTSAFVPVATNLPSVAGTNFIRYTDTVVGVEGRGFYQLRVRTNQ